MLLVLSEASIANGWAEDEVTRAFAEERQRGDLVLYPVCVDEAVFETKDAWAAKLRDDRRIGDFRAWRDDDAWQAAVNRVLRDMVDPVRRNNSQKAPFLFVQFFRLATGSRELNRIWRSTSPTVTWCL